MADPEAAPTWARPTVERTADEFDAERLAFYRRLADSPQSELDAADARIADLYRPLLAGWRAFRRRGTIEVLNAEGEPVHRYPRLPPYLASIPIVDDDPPDYAENVNPHLTRSRSQNYVRTPSGSGLSSQCMQTYSASWKRASTMRRSRSGSRF